MSTTTDLTESTGSSGSLMGDPDHRGRFGQFGGRYVPETLVAALEELTGAWAAVADDPEFWAEFDGLLRDPRRFHARL